MTVGGSTLPDDARRVRAALDEEIAEDGLRRAA